MTDLENTRLVLIGGSSHTGKSTVARALAGELGWNCLSTDKLAKHPGRPWRAPPKTVPEHVAEHYLKLSADELVTDVTRHYKDIVWPLAEAIVTAHALDDSSDRVVLEGSALLPELVAAMTLDEVAAVWLTACDETFKERIIVNSDYIAKSASERQMIDAFLERTLRYNRQLLSSLDALGLAPIYVEKFPTVAALTAACLTNIHQRRRP